MVQVSYPGVYVREIPSGVRTITGVATSIAVFVGKSRRGPRNQPVSVLGFTEFARIFSANRSAGELPDQVRQFFLNGGQKAYILRIASGDISEASVTLDDKDDADALVLTSVGAGEDENLLRVSVDSDTADATKLFNLRIARKFAAGDDDKATKEEEEVHRNLSTDPIHPRYVKTVLERDSRLVRATTVTGLPKPTTALTAFTGGKNGSNPGGTEYDAAYKLLDSKLDLFNLLILPKADGAHDRTTLWANASAFCLKRRAFLLMDAEDSINTVAKAVTEVKARRTGIVKDHSALYWPRLAVNPDGNRRFIDPSGTIAGVMARIDANRGVWKAPAGTEADLRGALGVEVPMSDGENGDLNPEAANAIRVFPNGIVSWGARTMDGFDNSGNDDYKYVPVRRFTSFIEESLFRGLKFAVFEPNDEPLWAQIRLAVGAFMNNLFRQGAFAGRTTRDAYFVKCDAESTTQNDINLGIVNVIVGFAPLKPAEFVVISLKQLAGQVQV